MNINEIQKTMQINYYDALIKYLNKINTKYVWLSDHLEHLKNDNEICSETTTEKDLFVVQKETGEDNDKKYEYLYNKPWTKLGIIHKIIKIKEYVQTLKMNSETERNKLQEKLIELIKLKILTKKIKLIMMKKMEKLFHYQY